MRRACCIKVTLYSNNKYHQHQYMRIPCPFHCNDCSQNSSVSPVTQPYLYSLFAHCLLLSQRSLVSTPPGRENEDELLFCVSVGGNAAPTISQNLLGKTEDESYQALWDLPHLVFAPHLWTSHLRALACLVASNKTETPEASHWKLPSQLVLESTEKEQKDNRCRMLWR